MEITFEQLQEMLETAFEGGREFGDTVADFYNTDQVSRHELETTPDKYEVVSEIMKPYMEFNV